jgi:hypothetical protein
MTSATSPQGDPSAAAAIELALSQVVPGRACGTCTLCCKLIAVTEFNKPPGEWCLHVVRKGGCGIHPTRPTGCRTFFCHWMTEKTLGPEWKPEKSKLVAVPGDGGHMTVFVDPGTPGAWRQAPYFETIQRWSREGARASPARIVTIRIATRVIVILDREIDLGHVGPDDSVRFEPGPDGRITARKVPREHAR